MRRVLSRCWHRYLHVAASFFLAALVLYVVLMQRIAINSHGDERDFKVSPRAVWNATVPAVRLTISTSAAPHGGKTTSVLLAGTPRRYKGYLTIGIPTLQRPKGEYFFSTLASLLQQSTAEQQRDVILMIMLADRNDSVNQRTLRQIQARYSGELSQGLILVASAPDTEHLFLAKDLKQTYGDSLDRVRWRSKQNLDYAALMEISANLSTYYLQIEDDVTAAPNYIQHIQTFVQENAKKEWAGLEVCPHGFIGKLFRSTDLPKLVTILRTFYLEMPCDFLIHHFYSLMLQKNVIRRKGNLFFHQGKYSSLVNQTRKVDHASSLQALPRMSKKNVLHQNPPAELHTSITAYKAYSLAAAYDLKTTTFFWGKDVKEGDDVTVVFKEPQRVARITVETGITDKTGQRRDIIRRGVVEFGFRIHYSSSGGGDRSKALCADTQPLGSFVDGRFNGSLSGSARTLPVRCFTLVVTQAQTDWLVISEIAVFPNHA